MANLSFEQGDVQSLPFGDGSFDIVLSQAVLFYLPRPEDAVQELRRVLRPGGIVIVMLNESPLLVNYPEDEGLQARLERVVPRLIDSSLARRLPLVMRAAGFESVSVEMETEREYTILGAARPAQLRNVAEILAPAMPHIGSILGERSEADAFLADLLAYLERPDTWSISALWITKGVSLRAVRVAPRAVELRDMVLVVGDDEKVYTRFPDAPVCPVEIRAIGKDGRRPALNLVPGLRSRIRA